jgi:hypothetical protein
MMMIDFVPLLDAPQTAAQPAKPVQGKIGIIVGEGIALKSEGRVDRIHPGAVKVPEKVIEGNVVP